MLMYLMSPLLLAIVPVVVIFPYWFYSINVVADIEFNFIFLRDMKGVKKFFLATTKLHLEKAQYEKKTYQDDKVEGLIKDIVCDFQSRKS